MKSDLWCVSTFVKVHQLIITSNDLRLFFLATSKTWKSILTTLSDILPAGNMIVQISQAGGGSWTGKGDAAMINHAEFVLHLLPLTQEPVQDWECYLVYMTNK